MPLFICEKCKCIENTATSGFWSNRDRPLCSFCETGKWHGRFEKIECTKEYYEDHKDSFVYGFWLPIERNPLYKGD